MLSRQAEEMKKRIDFGKDVFKIVHDFFNASDVPRKVELRGKPQKLEVNFIDIADKLSVSKETLIYALSFHNLILIMEHLWSNYINRDDESELPTAQQLVFETLALQSQFKTVNNIKSSVDETALADEIVAEQFINELDDDGLLLLSLNVHRKEK